MEKKCISRTDKKSRKILRKGKVYLVYEAEAVIEAGELTVKTVKRERYIM